MIKTCPCCDRSGMLGHKNGPINIDTLQIVVMYYVFCHCGMKTIEFVSKGQAIYCWNNRA